MPSRSSPAPSSSRSTGSSITSWTSALDARFDNDETGAPAYDPRVMLTIVLLGYSRGLVSSRAIERACRENVTFIAISGDSAPS